MDTEDKFYTGAERRRSNTLEMEAIEAIVERLMVKVITQHEEREKDLWKLAFPDGDPESHREYHQSKIDAAKAEQEFWNAIKLRLAETGIVGILRLLLWLVFLGGGAAVAARFGMLQTFLTMFGSK